MDKLGEEWARSKGIPVEVYEADWETYGRRAGYIRNASMALVADALIAIWDGESKGTSHMIKTALGKGLKVFTMYDYALKAMISQGTVKNLYSE